MSGVFEERIESYLAKLFKVSEVRVLEAIKIQGGASRETWSVEIDLTPYDEASVRRNLIVRMDPEASLLPSNRQVEYEVYRAFAKVPGVPVPAVVVNEDDPTALGTTFFVMEKVDGFSRPHTLMSADFDAVRHDLGRQMMQILGRIASADYRKIGLDETFAATARDDVWAIQLDYWERALHEHYMGPNPATEAAIRHLRRQPPPTPQHLSVVHGDFRVGNFLYDGERITAIVDWEMAHLGDPHEDLGWVFAKNWRFGDDADLVGGVLTVDEAIKYWEESSGLRVDPDTMRWYRLFQHVKAAAIWISGAHTNVNSSTSKYTFSHWAMVDTQEMWMLEDMGVVHTRGVV